MSNVVRKTWISSLRQNVPSLHLTAYLTIFKFAEQSEMNHTNANIHWRKVLWKYFLWSNGFPILKARSSIRGDQGQNLESVVGWYESVVWSIVFLLFSWFQTLVSRNRWLVSTLVYPSNRELSKSVVGFKNHQPRKQPIGRSVRPIGGWCTRKHLPPIGRSH